MSDIEDHKYLNFKRYWNQYLDGFPEKHIDFDSEQFVSYCNIRSDEKVLEIGIGGLMQVYFRKDHQLYFYRFQLESCFCTEKTVSLS